MNPTTTASRTEPDPRALSTAELVSFLRHVQLESDVLVPRLVPAPARAS